MRSEASYVVRARLAARTTLVRQRCEVDNQIRGLLKTFGILIGNAPTHPTRQSFASHPTAPTPLSVIPLGCSAGDLQRWP